MFTWFPLNFLCSCNNSPFPAQNMHLVYLQYSFCTQAAKHEQYEYQMLFSISSLCSLGLSRYPGCYYKYKYVLLLWQTAAAKGASGSAKEERPPVFCLFWSFAGLKVMPTWMSMGTQVSAWYSVVWQPASLSSLAFSVKKILSHSFLSATCSILFGMFLEEY